MFEGSAHFRLFSIVGERWIFFREALNPQAIIAAPAKRTAIDAALFPLQERLHEIAATPTVAKAKANETMITRAAFSPRVFPFFGSYHPINYFLPYTSSIWV